jgi:hypothetical protein
MDKGHSCCWRKVRQVQDLLASGAKAREPCSSDVAAKAATYKSAAHKSSPMVAEWRRSVKQRGEARGKKGLDIFLYGNVMFGHGEGGNHIGCV